MGLPGRQFLVAVDQITFQDTAIVFQKFAMAEFLRKPADQQPAVIVTWQADHATFRFTKPASRDGRSGDKASAIDRTQGQCHHH